MTLIFVLLAAALVWLTWLADRAMAAHQALRVSCPELEEARRASQEYAARVHAMRASKGTV